MTSSKVIVFGLEFQAALKAAHAVAPNTDYDVIQIRVLASGGNILVGARDPKHNMVMAVTVGTTMVDVVTDQDEVVEISKASAHQLMGMKVKPGDEEEDPLIGLTITQDRLSCTDETGMDLGLRLSRVRRLHFDDGPWLGNIEAMLARAGDSLPGETAQLSGLQWKKLSAVANAVGVDLELRPLQASDSGLSRALVVGDRVAGYLAHMPVRDDGDDQGTEEPLPLASDPLAAVRDAAEKLKADGVSVSVVTARPPRGAA